MTEKRITDYDPKGQEKVIDKIHGNLQAADRFIIPFIQYLPQIQVDSLDGGYKVRLILEGRFAKDFLTTKEKFGQLEKAVGDSLEGKEFTLELIPDKSAYNTLCKEYLEQEREKKEKRVLESKKEESKKYVEEKGGEIRARFSSSMAPSDDNRKSFYAHDGNRDALLEAERIISNIRDGKVGKPIGFISQNGDGKSSLVNSLMYSLLTDSQLANYVRLSWLSRELSNAHIEKREPNIRHMYRGKLIILDGIEGLVGPRGFRNGCGRESFKFWDSAEIHKRQIVFTFRTMPNTLKTPSEQIKEFETFVTENYEHHSDLLSRIKGSEVIPILPANQDRPDFIRNLLHGRKYVPTCENDLEYLAGLFNGKINEGESVRGILGVLERVLGYSRRRKQTLDEGLITEVFGEGDTNLFPIQKNLFPVPEAKATDILGIFSGRKIGGVPLDEIQGASTKKDAVMVRAFLAYALRAHCNLSSRKIGSLLGGRKSASVQGLLRMADKLDWQVKRQAFSDIYSDLVELNPELDDARFAHLIGE